jgi:hypothetical protein
MIGFAPVSGAAVSDAAAAPVGLPAQDQTAKLREGAVASLLAYGVWAAGKAVPVESERVDPVQSLDMPRIIVFADDSGESASKGGTAPAFDVTATLVVQMLAERALRADAVADLDAMIAQVKDCLFSDPAWLALSANVASVRTTRSLKYRDAVVLGDARMQIDCTWKEIYLPRSTNQRLRLVSMASTPPLGTQTLNLSAPVSTT